MEYPGSEYSQAAIQWVMQGNLYTARELFEQAVQIDPQRCDAWLGIYHCQNPVLIDRTGIEQLYRTMATLGEDQIAVGGEIGYLQAYFAIDLAEQSMTISTSIEIQAAWAISLVLHDELREAYTYLREYYPPTNPRLPEIMRLSWALLWRKARSWVELINIVQPMRSSPVLQLRNIAEFLFGEASAHLDRGNIAHEVLFQLGKDTVVPEDLASQAIVTKALLHRTEGDEKKAEFFLDKAYQLHASSKIMELKSHKKYQLVFTSEELISARIDFLDPSTEPQLSTRTEHEIQALREALLAEAEIELSAQIGMESVKEKVHMLKAKIESAEKRKSAGLPTVTSSHNLALTGPPGTGKTTIARILAKIYAGLGIISQAEIIEVGRKDLVGEHLGSTAPKTQAVLEKARGGILFIDEAYTLNPPGLIGGDAFGKEAIDTILTFMENFRDEIIIIIAGYENEIMELLEVNPGLRSRIPRSITFPSYTPQELVAIAHTLAKPRGSTLSPAAETILFNAATQKIETLPGNNHSEIDIAGNGRWIRNVLESAEDYRDYRISSLDSSDISTLMIIAEDDIQKALINL